MRVPLSWLKAFVDIDVPVEELAHRLTMAGLEVEGIEYLGLPGGELPWDKDKVLVCNILDVRQHPNADKLVLADVDYGAGQPHTVVTGAPNLQPYKDKGPVGHPLKSVFAKEGAELYDGHAEGKVKVKLKGRPVRGVMSDAMLCSEKELGISDEHEGILFLPEDAPTGAPLADYLGDVVIEIAITPNYARALSILGVAREVAALLGKQVHIPELSAPATGPSIEGRFRVTVEAPTLCPRFTATLIEGIEIKPSPYWMQRRLMLAGMRPISNVVDVTNYLMLEIGQPSHSFDADTIAEQHLIVRPARESERLTTLDGKERTLTPERLLVADPTGPLSIAGVMGGETSEVTASTTRVLLEAASWEPATIRKTARAYALPSEASRRFERGVDWELPVLLQQRATALLQQTAGGTIAQGMIDIYPQPWQQITLDLTPAEVRRIVGIDLSAAEIAALLAPLGFGCAVEADVVRVTVPSSRQDVTILADLCEEVARMYGYDRIPGTLLSDALPKQQNNVSFELEQKARDTMVGCGLDEAMTYSMTSMPSVAAVSPADADPALHMRVSNPNTPDREYMRRSLLPVFLEAVAGNLREQERVLQFEIGRVYLRQEGQVLPAEPRYLAIAMAGPRTPLSWHQRDAGAIDFFDVKGAVETLVERLHIGDQVEFAPLDGDPRLQPGRAAVLRRRAAPRGKAPAEPGAVLGVLGELHPDVRERLGIETRRVAVAELDLEQLIALSAPAKYRPISRYPATIQDLAMVVETATPADAVAQAIRKYAGNTLESLVLFDVYQGPQVGEGKQSLAYRLTFRAQDRTLGDADLAKIRQKIIRGLEHDVKATIRA
ncbi:phenylalanine--tRNA ligase subunit beta [Chloroflexia bacterium SDU3-3]|nr:phenylalanine--tRNA ligase subunit beta [Chloroflexia bacterium SDU3-3]